MQPIQFLTWTYQTLNYSPHGFFEKNKFNRTLVKGDSASLSTLDEVLGDNKAKSVMLETNSLEDAANHINQTPTTFTSDLKHALTTLERAHGYIHTIDNHNVDDLTTLKDLFNLCKTMRDTIKAKGDDEEF